MRSFPRFLFLLASLLCGGANGFVRNGPNVALSPPHLSSVIATTRLPPLVQQVASVPVEPLKESSPLVSGMKNAARKYMTLSEEKPILTKGVSAALVGAVGDVFSQSLFAYATGARFQWDMMRTLTFMMMGLFFKGPALHMWYNVLGRVAHWTKVRKGFGETKQSLTALTLDQTLGVAIFYPLYFIVFELFSSTLCLRCTCKNNHLRDNMFGVWLNSSLPIFFAFFYSTEYLGTSSQNGGDFDPRHCCTILCLASGSIPFLQVLPSFVARTLL